MVKRSLQASSAGIQQAKRAFTLKGWTQENLAGEVNLKTRQPIWRFFTRQPVDRQIFMEVCNILDLDWREIAQNPPADFSEPGDTVEAGSLDLTTLVNQVRSRQYDAIENQCGILQLLDINHPVNIHDIYVDANILEEVPSQQSFEIADLNNLALTQFDRVGLGDIEEKQIAGIQAVETYSKLRVLGKPGSGKTTFLQYLAIQCNRGEFAVDQIPVFISLRALSEESRRNDEFSLVYYLHQLLFSGKRSNLAALETILQAGRVLLLLDGMDEVLNQDITAVLKEIRKFSEKYHKNRLIASCRTASQKLQLRGFTDVEIAPFTQPQITVFAQKWFVALTKSTVRSGENQAIQFISKLDLTENWQFRQLVGTPLFLHLACWVFQGQGKFPTKQTDFYKQGLDLLLGKWDEARGVERDEVYRGFLLPQKLRLLSQLAAVTFEHGEYFFEQEVIENYIADYLKDLPGPAPEPEELQLESQAVLKSIEAQHGFLIERARGIFSFSYLVFQEYLTARKIVASHNLQALEQALGGLVSHITDPHWREVFLLTTGMLRSADSLVQLMKQQVDGLVAHDPHLQDFLNWANQKAHQKAPIDTQLATKRAFYLAFAKSPNVAGHFALASTLDQGMLLDAILEEFLRTFSMNYDQEVVDVDACNHGINQMIGMVLDPGFSKSLQQLKEELPLAHENEDQLQEWWTKNYSDWVESLRCTIDRYRNIHQSWQFTPEQQQVLQRYYDANQLLIDCLNSNSEVTAAIRKEIESTLLLPQKDLEDREWTG